MFVLLNCLTCRTIVNKWTAIIIFDKIINITEFFFKGDVKIFKIHGGQCFMGGGGGTDRLENSRGTRPHGGTRKSADL